MRWLSFAILAYFTIAVQVALSGFLNWGAAAPNLVLPVAVFIAINAKREEALLGTFILGALQDLFTQQPPGLYAFSYGLVGLFVMGAQPAVYRDHPLTHVFVTLLAGLVTGAVVFFNEWAYPALHEIADAPRPSVWRMALGAGYTALLAPVMLAGLVRMKKAFGFRNQRASAIGGHHSAPMSHVR